MVPRRGDAPRSAGYRPAALLLSYRGMKKLAEHQRMPCAIAHHLNARRIWHGLGRGTCTLDALIGRSGFRDRFLVYAGRAPFEMVEPDGNAPSLAGCKPAVQSSTLRSLWKLAVETGAALAVSSLTRRRVCCYSSRPKNLDAGDGVAPTKTGL
jgi:hypothetical protein